LSAKSGQSESNLSHAGCCDGEHPNFASFSLLQTRYDIEHAAHSLFTPLAVIFNEAHGVFSIFKHCGTKQKVEQQEEI
jgi:hypothetical protein